MGLRWSGAVLGWCLLRPAGVVAAPAVQHPAQVRPWEVVVTETALERIGAGPDVEVQRAFGGPGADSAYDIWSAPDGGWILVGSAEDPGSGDLDVALVRLDPAGDVLWAKRYGGPGLDIGFAVRVLADEQIVVAGWTRRLGAGEGDVLLLGLEPDGALAFERTFGTRGEERGTALVVDRRGNLVVVGESYGEDGDAGLFLVIADPRGNPLQERTYDNGPLNERGLAALALEDGYVLVGNSMDTRSGSTATLSDGYVVRTDREGTPLWSRTYGGEGHDIFHHVVALPTGGLLLTGYTRGFGASGESDVWLVRVDDGGEVRGQELHGGAGADHNILARPSGPGRVALAGYTTSSGVGGWDAEVMELDARGRLLWSAAYGGPGEDGAVALVPIDGEGLAVAGFTASSGAGRRDFLFMRLAAGPESGGG